MSQEILLKDLFLEEALVVDEEGKTALEIFTKALKGKVLSAETLQYFKPLINSKGADWDDIVHLTDKLQVLPHIAGG
ncbi:hypothetical protein LCGC14_1774480 [marine sediment metagenome]|uniref:Uncharacterized protein n=1 Tax=marine sediment metagenome TaxID=412755 RepID=A0A0F9JC79_9ZZZZ